MSKNIFPKIVPPVPGAVLLEVYEYGERQMADKLHNYRGHFYQHKDGGGLQQINSYDFKSNPLQTQQQLLNDATLTEVDWDSSPALSTEVFTGAVTYDALNRPVNTTDPGGNVQAFTYDKGGLLKTVTLNNDDYVNDIHYDAKGQRQAIWYGNGTKMTYTYDPDTFRLRRLLTVKLSSNEILQDLNYYYEPVGNITTIRDDAQQTLFFNNSVVSPTQEFTYDALYRLIEATGRELKGTASFGNEDNWNDAPWMGQPQPSNGSAVQTYTQHYIYDSVGNILSLQHVAGTGSYTRTYAIDTASNKLLSTTVGSNTYHYTHDTQGNMLTMPHLSSMAWNLNNELKIIVRGTNTTYYQYSGGQRIRKYTDKGSIKEERIYLGSYEIYRKFDHTSSLIIERTTVHVSDDTGRIAMLEKRTYGTAAEDNNTAATLTRYIYSNHLQSASLELDENAAIISYEEYHPYGTTSYQAMNASIKAVAKRYRYTGKERDEESGLYYHGARYYIPWLARWSASDPMENKRAGLSPYDYCSNNPINKVDVSGMLDGWVRTEDNQTVYDSSVNADNVTSLYGEKAKILTGGFESKAGYVELYDKGYFTINGGELQHSEDKNKMANEYNSFNFNHYGYYRNNYSSEGFSDATNYLRFLDNAAGSVWNFGAEMVNDVRYGSWDGTVAQFKSWIDYFPNLYTYATTTPAQQQFNETVSGFKNVLSNIRTYENLVGALMTANASRLTTVTVSETAASSTTLYQGINTGGDEFLTLYRGENSNSLVMKSYAAKEGGYAYSQGLIKNSNIDDLMKSHAFDSRNPTSPFISVTSNPDIARYFAGPNGTVHTLRISTTRVIFNKYNNYVIPGIGNESEYLVPNYIRLSEIIKK